jgi:hypothetical protein
MQRTGMCASIRLKPATLICSASSSAGQRLRSTPAPASPHACRLQLHHRALLPQTKEPPAASQLLSAPAPLDFRKHHSRQPYVPPATRHPCSCIHRQATLPALVPTPVRTQLLCPARPSCSLGLTRLRHPRSAPGSYALPATARSSSWAPAPRPPATSSSDRLGASSTMPARDRK